MNAGSFVRAAAAMAASCALSCGGADVRVPPPSPEPSAAPSAAVSAGPAPEVRRTTFAALRAPPPPAAMHYELRYVDLARAPGSPALEAAGKALEAADHATAKQELAAALKKLDPAADFVAWLVGHTLWGRACKATGDAACAEREYEIVRSAWADPGAAEQKARGAEPDAGVQRQSLARAVAAAGEALYFFADKQRREKVEPIKLPEYKGEKTQKGVSRYLASDVLPWLHGKIKAMNAVELEYSKIVTMAPGPSALWAIEAGAATGRIWDALAREILRTPMPAEFKKPGHEEAARDWQQILVVTSFPTMKRARNAFGLCRDFAARNAGYDEIAKECVDWLARNPAPDAPPAPPDWMRGFLPADVLKATSPGAPP